MSAYLVNCGAFLALLLLLGLALWAANKGGAKGGCALLVAALVLLGVAVGWRNWRAQRQLREMTRAFEPAVAAIAAKAPQTAQAAGTRVCRRGRMLLVEDQAPHALQLRLPERLRAQRPDEVETLGLLDCKEVTVGTYRRPLQSGRGRDAIRHVCELELVDLAAGRRFARSRFAGSEPPTSPGFLDVTQGSFPDGKILDHLAKLPPCDPVPSAALVTPVARGAPAAGPAPVVTDLTVEEEPDGDRSVSFRVADPDGDLDVAAEQRVYLFLRCDGVSHSISTSAAWQAELRTAKVRIARADLQATGECKLTLTVRDQAGHVSAPVEGAVMFR